ncbi:hypothetical protein FRC01_007745 [Tulasnella sp. 417]|nr:hypothetical protein FRC01_007745 [Tulasnella sp. 417]
MRGRQGQYDDAFACFAQALQISTGTDDRHGRASALWRLAEIHRCRCEYNEARANYSEALQIWTELADALCRLTQGRQHRYEGHELYSQDLILRTELCYRTSQANALCGLAQVDRLQCNHEAAITLYIKALQIYIDVDDERGKANALRGLDEVHRDRREDSEAIPSATVTPDILVEFDDKCDGFIDDWGFVNHPDLEENHEATRLCADALRICTELSETRCRGSTQPTAPGESAFQLDLQVPAFTPTTPSGLLMERTRQRVNHSACNSNDRTSKPARRWKTMYPYNLALHRSWVSCELCGKTFSRRDNLDRHMVDYH